MHDLLDDLRNAPTPLIARSRVSILNAVKEVHLAVLRGGLVNDVDVTPDRKVAMLRRYALWLEDILFGDFPPDQSFEPDSETEHISTSAATLYELVGNLAEDQGAADIFHPPLNDWIRSSILSSFSSYQAKSTLIGKRVRDRIMAIEVSDPVAICHRLVALVVSDFMARSFVLAFDAMRQLLEAVPAALAFLDARKASNAEFLTLDRAIAIAKATGNGALGIFLGVDPLVNRSIERLMKIKEACLRSGDADHLWLASRLLHVTSTMRDASMHRHLKNAGFPADYRRALTQDGYLEFWKPQLAAIAAGLLTQDERKNFVISIPTGSGKTLFAELSILGALKGKSAGWALYVAPSRALVSQVSSDLRRRLDKCGIKVKTIVAGAEQSGFLEQELEFVQTDRTVTVTTPEKLDAYFRNAEDLFRSCRLVIFDEVHKVADPDRGPLLESLIARFLETQPNTRIILLSGVMSNVDELKTWLGFSETEGISSRVRSTRRVYGVAVRGEQRTGDTVQRANGEKYRRVDFDGGLVVVYDRHDLEGDIQVDLPRMFRGHYRQTLYGARWREDRRSAGRSSVNENATRLAEKIACAPGTLIVFMNAIKAVEKACREFSGGDDRFFAERSRLSNLLAAELGKSHSLVDRCLRGVAYHHAALPTTVQRAIELALEEGWLRVVFATPTLREGVNTSATTVIVAGNSFYHPGLERKKELAESDFLNLAGRAGRPRTDTEGRVFLVPDSLAQATAVERGKKYLLVGEEALRVRSQLFDLANALDTADSILSLPTIHQSFLLALDAAGICETEELNQFINSTLWAIQEDDGELIRRTGRHIHRLVTHAKDSLGVENIQLAASLGLSLTSSEMLRKTLEEKQDLFSSDRKDLERIDQIGILIDVSIKMQETARGWFSAGKGLQSSNHVAVFLQWLGGASFSEILAAGKESQLFQTQNSISDAVRYASDVSNWLSWSFGAAYTVLRHLSQNTDPYYGTLPLLARYGVPSTVAAYISLLGVSDRVAARYFAKRFEEENTEVDLETVATWLEKVDINSSEGIFSETDFGLRREIVQRQVFPRFYRHQTYNSARVQMSKSIAAGDVLSVKYTDGTFALASGDATVGRIIDDRFIHRFRADQVSRLIAVASEDINSELGRILIVSLSQSVNQQ